MKLRVLGCSGGQVPGHKLSAFLIDNQLLIDAGSATEVLDLKAQRKIADILITHTHLDHVFSLGTLADNLYGKHPSGIDVWSVEAIIHGLKKHFFNEEIWPDFTKITGPTQPAAVLRLRCIPSNKPTRVGAYTVTLVPVNHVVASVAFFIEKKNKTLLHMGDTGPTSEVWSLANSKDSVAAVIIETSFPNRFQDIADASQHLTPRHVGF